MSDPAEAVDLGSEVVGESDWRPDPKVAIRQTRDDAPGGVREPIEADDLAIRQPQRPADFLQTRHGLNPRCVRLVETAYRASVAEI